MTTIELIVIAIGLGMDAFAVSVCKGLAMKKYSVKNSNIVAGYFGFFQGFMPFIGYMIGYQFQNAITSIDHYIAFVLLVFIGIQMILESRKKDEENVNDKLDFKTMLILSIATSIDALAVGVTFAFLNVNILLSIIVIAVITYIMSFSGVKIGNVFGIKYKSKAELAGGIILILMGSKILIEHLGILEMIFK